MVEGLEGERTALIAKVHHAILDGVSGASVLAAFLDLKPRSRIVPLPPEWDPDSVARPTRRCCATPPSSLTRQPGAALSTLAGGGRGGGRSRACTTGSSCGRGEQSPPGFFSAPRTSFNGAVSNRKRFSSLSVPLEDVKLVGRVFEATVNDVILAVRLGRAAPPARRPRGGGRASARRHGAGVDPARGRGRGTGQPDLGDVGVAGQRRRRSGRTGSTPSPSRRGWPRSRRSCTGGRFVGDLAQIAAAGAGVPGGACGGRHADSSTGCARRSTSRSRASRVPDFSLFCAGSRVAALVPGRPDRRRDRTQRDDLLVSRPGALRAAWPAASCSPSSTTWRSHIDDALGELVGCALDARGAVG